MRNLAFAAAICCAALWVAESHAQSCTRRVGDSSTVVYVFLPVSTTVSCCAITDPNDPAQYAACVGPGAGDFAFPDRLDGSSLMTCIGSGVPGLTLAISDPPGTTIDDLAVRLETAIDFALCELDVDVHVSTSPPDFTAPPLAGAAKWTVVVAGQDNFDGSIGYAQPTQLTPDPQRNTEYARIWVDALATWAGAELTGANNTLERWATTLANFIAHETVHGFNATHANACPMVPNAAGEEDLIYCFIGAPTDSGCDCWRSLATDACHEPSFWPTTTDELEDPAWNHLVAQPDLFVGGTPPTGCINPAQHVTELQHPSDVNIGITGGIVGLSIKTLSNWDFHNLNNQAADGMVMTLIRKQPTTGPVLNLSLTRFYAASRGPWVIDTTLPVDIPRVTGPVKDPRQPGTGATIGGAPTVGELTINGETYDIYELVATDPNPIWPHATPDGLVPPGPPIEFHTGITFAEPDVMLFGVRLTRKNATDPTQFDDLLLQPRFIEFGSGAIPPAPVSGSSSGGGGFGDPGMWGFDAFNWDRQFAGGDLIIEQFQVRQIPRRVDLEAMVVDAQPISFDGRPVQPLRRRTRAKPPEFPLQVGADPAGIPVASLADERFLDTLGVKCTDQRPELCAIAGQLGLFPSTYVYISGTVLDPAARHWDTNLEQFVTGPIRTRFFRQVPGFHPDLNNNGVDDRIDIVVGGSADTNNDGVPDEAVVAVAQQARRWYLRLGIADASGFDPGLELGAGGEWLKTGNRSLDLALGYREFGGNAGTDVAVTNLSLALRQYVGGGSTAHNGLWLQAGVGIYDVDLRGTGAGVAIGVGYRRPLGSARAFEAALQHHELSDGPDFDALTIGMSFDWP